jgi:HlyD family secretion protein
VSTAKSELQDAQDEFAKYASLKEGNSDRKRAKDDLDSAQKKYDDAVAAQADLENEYRQLKSSLDLAQAQWDETRRTLELRQDGPDKDQLALAQIRLEAATARVAAADKALSDLELVAPYNGTVAKLDISEGERVVPNQPVATFADFSKWYVETTDLTENEVVDVKEGQHVVIIPDALSDLELNGVVENISQAYSEKAGDIVYKARILLSNDDPRLRWGLTVETRFLNEE